MPETPPDDAPVRPAAVVDVEIRALTAGRDWWSRAELERLRGLQAEWLRAHAREQALAA